MSSLKRASTTRRSAPSPATVSPTPQRRSGRHKPSKTSFEDLNVDLTMSLQSRLPQDIVDPITASFGLTDVSFYIPYLYLP